MLQVDIPDVLVEGEICTASDDIRLLRDGMLHVGVGPFSIDVSWWPEHDQIGCYVITVYGTSWEERLPSWETQDASKAIDIVQRAAMWLQSVGGLG